jgi:hypothetical protein
MTALFVVLCLVTIDFALSTHFGCSGRIARVICECNYKSSEGDQVGGLSWTG